MSEIDDTYRTIAAPCEGTCKEKGSKFTAFLYPIQHEDEIKNFVQQLKKEYYDARHHCYAYILGAKQEKAYSNDDGEPSGTAGKPILGQLLSFEVTNVLAVVVRYFGGTKLGTSGLITAYKTATRDALEQAEIITKNIEQTFKIEFDYLMMNPVMKILKDEDLKPFNQNFDVSCSLFFSIRLRDAERVKTMFEKLESVHISNF